MPASEIEFEKWWYTKHQTIGKVAARAAWDYQTRKLDKLKKQNEILQINLQLARLLNEDM